jgi:hypothetical protein
LPAKAARQPPNLSQVHTAESVGASLLAKVVNDDAFQQEKRGVYESFASKLGSYRDGGF